MSILIARQRLLNNTPWDVVSKETRNLWHIRGNESFIYSEPELLNTWHDALLSGLAEQMARSMDWPVPDWCNNIKRTQNKALFINCPTALMKSLALTETAIGFRKHNLFIGKIDIRPAKSGIFSILNS